MEQHTITWRHVEIEITYTPEKFGMVDHIELRTKNKAALPVTETGYRSHFVDKGSVAAHGGAVAFVTAWLDHEAERSNWSNDQLSLF
ncbi:hypothetical protein [uncultured Roseobacter sp.]|uniref:hypothetical protein n=1 Tax=uncultured Roseobacter sp. TaxID=114847 RepID=UPI00261307F9|nr:hypothetical protein [uncultured Roseobacter sp.]